MYEDKKGRVKNFIEEVSKGCGSKSEGSSYYEMFEKAVSMLQPAIYLELKSHIEMNLKNENLKKAHLEILMKYQPRAV